MEYEEKCSVLYRASYYFAPRSKINLLCHVYVCIRADYNKKRSQSAYRAFHYTANIIVTYSFLRILQYANEENISTILNRGTRNESINHRSINHRRIRRIILIPIRENLPICIDRYHYPVCTWIQLVKSWKKERDSLDQ